MDTQWPELLNQLFNGEHRRSLLVFFSVFVVAAISAGAYWTLRKQPAEWSYSAFSQAVAAGEVSGITIEDGGLSVIRKSGASAFVRLPAGMLDVPTLDRLAAAGIEVDIGRPGDDFLGFLSVIGSLLLTGVVATVLVVQFDLRGRLSWPAAAKAVPDRFTDVAGQEEPKSELAEIVSFLKNPGGFAKVGARPPHGVLMVGPPGTGKTLLARALAGEAGVTFMAVAGSEFSAAFVGVSKTRVARLFKEARRKAPCILFIDEIDSLGKKRGAGSSAADREYDTTLNQLLVEMDGFEASAGVIVVGATNRVDVLDPALLRPGRFDRQIHVGLPDIGGREAILRVHVAKVPLAADVVLRTVARGTPGFTGADLANLVNEAAVFAARSGCGTRLRRRISRAPAPR